MSNQMIFSAKEGYKALEEYITKSNIKSVLVVSGIPPEKMQNFNFFNDMENRIGVKVAFFTDFEVNPDYISAEIGVDAFHNNHCEAVIAIGGGSAIDVAKCIKLFASLNRNECYLHQTIALNDIPLIAIPTTAGTGSEATKFAVVYHNGEKISVTHDSSVPSFVILDAGLLRTLPDYQKKATLLDALCHSIESFWSVNSTEESKEYSKEAIALILSNTSDYLKNEDVAAEKMLLASNLAGKAINISQTTAGHALSYKITTLYGIPHGLAVAICLEQVWKFMLDNMDKCNDLRGESYLRGVFDELALAFGCSDPLEGYAKYLQFFNSLSLQKPKATNDEDFEILCKSVNAQRLKNNPVTLNNQDIAYIYKQMLNK